MTYFLQVNLCWLVFYGLYYVLLSRETFFTLNRIYLIISLLCGLAMPFFTERLSQMEAVSTMPIMKIAQPIAQSISIFQENIETPMPLTENSWSLWMILRGLYLVGIFYFLTQFVVGLFRIFKLYKNGLKEKMEGFILVNSNEVKAPFSFFNFIFINSKIAQSLDFQHIMLHEQAHVQQKHSFDIVGMEILRGLFWLSPLVHLYARSLRHVHEYLADSAVLQNTEKKQYGRLLINQTAAGSGLVLANHFNFSQLKKRVIMMTRNRSQRVALVKYTLAAPLFIVLIILLAAPKNGLMAKTEDLSNKMGNTIEAIETKVKETLEPNITKNLQSQPIPIANNSLPNNLIVKIEDGGAGGVMNVANFKKCQFLKVTQFMQEANVQWKIKDFIVQKVSKSGVSSRIKNQGNIFNNVVKALINQAETGDIFHFTDIFIASYNDNRAGNWGNISFTLTQTFMYGIPTLSTGKTGGIISKKNIQISSTSGLMLKDSKKYRVYSFKMTHYSLDKSKTSTIENNGAAFTEASKKLLEALEVGDNLKMDNIRVVDSDGKIIEIPDKTDFTIGAAELKDKVPQPFPTINGFRGMHIDLDRFKKLDEIIPYQSNEFGYFEAMPKNLGEIESFTLKKKDEGEAIFCKGNHFDAVVKQLIMNAKQGDTYRFQNIVFKMNSGVMLKWNLGEMVFIIKKVPFGDWSTRAKWFVRMPPINFFGELHSDTELVICTINRYAQGEQKPSEQVQFTGFNWSDEAKQLFQKAKAEDIYEFDNIKARRRGQTTLEDFAAVRYKLN